MNTFDEAIREISNEVADLVISKQKDYGTKNILESPIGPEQGIIIRLFDKAARIENLNEKTLNRIKLQLELAKDLKTYLKDVAKNEPLEDSWKDIIGYGLIGIMLQRNVFTLPLKENTEVANE